MFFDVEAQTDHEILPSGRIVLIREIRKARDGEPFRYFRPEGGSPIAVQGMPPRDVAEYLMQYRRWKQFGFANGKGWGSQLPWVVDLIEFLDDAYQEVQAWHIDKASKGVTGSASPDDLGLEA